MRRTLRICRNAWTRFGNCPGSPLPVLPLSDSGQRCRPASFFPFPARLRLPFLRLSKGRKPCLSLLRRDNSVREPNVQPAPATGLKKGFGVLPQQAETAVSGNAGNRCFEHLWEQMPCLPSSEFSVMKSNWSLNFPYLRWRSLRRSWKISENDCCISPLKINCSVVHGSNPAGGIAKSQKAAY